MAMDKKLKAAWIKALRSGRYKQTQETLKDEGGYCCLGVLLTISRKGEWQGFGTYKIDEEEFCDGDLGECGRRMFGITSRQEGKLVRMNDGANGDEHHDFKGIARWIDQNIKVKAAR